MQGINLFSFCWVFNVIFLGDGCVVALVLMSIVLCSGVAKHLAAATLSRDPVSRQT